LPGRKGGGGAEGSAKAMERIEGCLWGGEFQGSASLARGRFPFDYYEKGPRAQRGQNRDLYPGI